MGLSPLENRKHLVLVAKPHHQLFKVMAGIRQIPGRQLRLFGRLRQLFDDVLDGHQIAVDLFGYRIVMTH